MIISFRKRLNYFLPVGWFQDRNTTLTSRSDNWLRVQFIACNRNRESHYLAQFVFFFMKMEVSNPKQPHSYNAKGYADGSILE